MPNDSSYWRSRLESAREAARRIDELTRRIDNGGRDWSDGGSGGTATVPRPTESAAMLALALVPLLEKERADCEEFVGSILACIQRVRDGLGEADGDILEMFYIDRMFAWEIANELGMKVDGVFYRKRKAIDWMDANLAMVG